jgi:hypothetical protein
MRSRPHIQLDYAITGREQVGGGGLVPSATVLSVEGGGLPEGDVALCILGGLPRELKEHVWRRLILVDRF